MHLHDRLARQPQHRAGFTCLTALTNKSRAAVASVAVDVINASAAIQTWLTLTVVDV